VDLAGRHQISGFGETLVPPEGIKTLELDGAPATYSQVSAKF